MSQRIRGGNGDVVHIIAARISWRFKVGRGREGNSAGAGIDGEQGSICAGLGVGKSCRISDRRGISGARGIFGKVNCRCAGERRVGVVNDKRSHRLPYRRGNQRLAGRVASDRAAVQGDGRDRSRSAIPRRSRGGEGQRAGARTSGVGSSHRGAANIQRQGREAACGHYGNSLGDRRRKSQRIAALRLRCVGGNAADNRCADH